MPINYRDCMMKKGDCVWVAYQKQQPRLPFAVASTSEELARLVGVQTGVVQISNWQFKHGKLKHGRYVCVPIGGD